MHVHMYVRLVWCKATPRSTSSIILFTDFAGKLRLAASRLLLSISLLSIRDSNNIFCLDCCQRSLSTSLRAINFSSVHRLLFRWFEERTLFSIINFSNNLPIKNSAYTHTFYSIYYITHNFHVTGQRYHCLHQRHASSSNFGFFSNDQILVSDRQTDRQTNGRTDAINIFWAFLVKN